MDEVSGDIGQDHVNLSIFPSRTFKPRFFRADIAFRFTEGITNQAIAGLSC